MKALTRGYVFRYIVGWREDGDDRGLQCHLTMCTIGAGRFQRTMMNCFEEPGMYGGIASTVQEKVKNDRGED